MKKGIPVSSFFLFLFSFFNSVVLKCGSTLESSQVYFKIYQYLGPPLTSQIRISESGSQRPLGYKCLLSNCRVWSVLLTTLGLSVKLQSTNHYCSCIPEKRPVVEIHVYNSTLPVSTIALLCIFLEPREVVFLFCPWQAVTWIEDILFPKQKIYSLFYLLF